MSFAESFWATVELLVALDTSHAHPFEDDVEDWLENVSSKVRLHLKAGSDDQSNDEDSESVCDDSVDYGNLVDCSFSYSPVRTRLELLMGSNVVRLTDRKYMMKLIAKIREEHERKQEARIQDRKMRELMRTKDMILNRFIGIQEAPAEIRQYPLFQLYLYCDSVIERRRKRSASRKVKIPASLHRLLYPQPSSEDLEADEGEHEELPMKEVVVDGETIMVPLTAEEIEQQAKQKEVAEDIKSGYMFTKEEYENLHYEADAVKKLKDTKTINEMYRKAHEIVGSLFSLAANEKRKRCAMDEDPVELPVSTNASVSNVRSETTSASTITAASIKSKQ